MIAVIDYRAGNVGSVARALSHLGFKYGITSDPKELSGAGRAIFPGVGSAGQAMEDLKEMGLDSAIRKFYESGRPFLGICLGSQIIMEESEEDNAPCLGLIPGRVRRFPIPLFSHNGIKLKVPHMGWNRVDFLPDHVVFEGVTPGSEFYFVHSYFPLPEKGDSVAGTTEYGITFASALCEKNLAAVQFHPEKSGEPGLRILNNFCLWNS